jgi:two-component system phosphate regulon sensor histidine kinase PhoR
MLRSRFFWKLYSGYFALILLFTLLVGTLVGREIDTQSLRQIEQNLSEKAALLREISLHPLKFHDGASLQERIRKLGNETETRLTVIRSDGIVIADSDAAPSSMDNHLLRPEIQEALSKGSGAFQRFSRTMGKDMMYLALSVKEEGKQLGFVRVSVPVKDVHAQFALFREMVALGAGISAVVALFLGFFLARRFIGPLASMTEAARSISQGDYDQKLRFSTKDEVGALAEAFNAMSWQLRDRIHAVSSDRAKLFAILSNMVEGVIAVDQDEKVVHINRAAGEILHTGSQESMNKRIWEVTRVREVCLILADALREGEEKRGEISLPSHPREQIIEVRASPLRDENGETSGALIVLHDISELRRLEGMRKDFVANVSHELKTPLTAIRALVETLLDDKEMEREIQERFLEKMKKQSIRLSNLVTDLLSISRLESGKEERRREILDLRDSITESIQSIAPGGLGQKPAIHVEFPETPVKVLGDKEALRQLVDNLLDNAVKYSPAEASVEVRLRVEGNRAIMEVKDRGIGIEPHHQERIFERFYRVDKARSREVGGTGLGLSIVKQIALALGGKVSVESTPGGGSTFRVQLPLAGNGGELYHQTF